MRLAIFIWLPIVKALIAEGANPNKRCNQTGYTALHLAAQNGHAVAIRELIKGFADPNLDYQVTATKQQREVILAEKTKLVHRKHPADIDFKSLFSNKSIEEIKAEGEKKVERIRRLELAGLLLRYRQPLHLAIHNKEAVIALIEGGANLNVKDAYGFTPLHLAASAGQIEVIEALIKSGAEVDEQDDQGNTALHLAIVRKEKDAVIALLEGGANPNIKENSNSFTPLHLAASAGQIEVIEALIKSRAEVDEQDDQGNTALHLAIVRKEKDAVIALLEGGANPNIKENSNSFTPLHLAANTGQIEVIEALIKSEAEVDEQDDQGNTALHLAIVRKEKDAVIALLEGGANPNIKENSNSFTPLHLAANTGQIEVIEALIKSRAEVDEQDDQGNTALHLAIVRKEKDAVIALLDGGANPYIENNENYTALALAAALKETTVMKTLVTANIGLSGNLHDGLVVLLQAIEHGYKELALILIDMGYGSEAYKNIMNESLLAKNINEIAKIRKKAMLTIDSGLFNQEYHNVINANLGHFNKEIFPALNKIASDDLAHQLGLKNPLDDHQNNVVISGECPICFDETENLLDCIGGNDECTHQTCSDCLKENLEHLIKNRHEKPVCPNQQCRSLVKLANFYQAGCDKENIDALQSILVRFSAQTQWKDYKPCFTPECINGKRVEDDNNYFSCPICTFEGCLECGKKICGQDCVSLYGQKMLFAKLYKLGKLPPPPKPYSEYKDDDDESFHGRYRMCPHCGQLNERSEGCNGMKCNRCSGRYHWNDGLNNVELHDYARGHMNYEDVLRQKGFLKLFDDMEDANVL
ncbi:MAG: ankyrin repeat domain-containing protein [Myxococcales bacterium]|nr:MAG: ankyrin repeat domain-containing protein [Myxococcales bacterium]